VRKPVELDSVQRAHLASTVLGQGAVPAVDFETTGSRWCDAEFETGGVDDQIDWVLRAVEDDSVAADPVEAPTLRVDQRDVRTVERRKVVFMEARPLAEPAVVGLESGRGLRVTDLLVDPGPDTPQFREVPFDQPGHGVPARAVGHGVGDAAPDRGPLVPHQVLVLVYSRKDRV